LSRRIGIVTYDFYPFLGGQGRYVWEVWRQLQTRPDLDLQVFSPARNDLPGHHRAFSWTRSIGLHLGFSFMANLAMNRWAGRHGLDLFHLHGGPGGVFLVLRPSVPVLYTIHHTWAQQRALLPGGGWRRMMEHVEGRSCRLASRITADSQSTKEWLLRTHGIEPEKIEVVPCGVDVDALGCRDQARLPNSLLFVGRLEERKGVPFLLDSIALVVRQVPEVHLYVIGQGSLRRALDRQVAALDIGKNVTFLGPVSDDELAAWYNRVCVAVVPSVFEGFGLTAVEALACGTPVIATRTDGLKEVVADGEDGLLVTYGRAEEMAAAIVDLLSNVETRERLAANARARAADLLSWGSVAGRFAELYEVVPSGALGRAG
jgi:glycosyltransferase involved in cell wall biosynthesis